MRTFEDQSEALDHGAIDRLVAGDLTEPERRALLLRLEADPDGWRRCALAFLEDQAWSTALAADPARIIPPMTSEVVSPRRFNSRRGWSRRFSIAAGLLLSAYAAGYATSVFHPNPPPEVIARPLAPAVVPEDPRPDEVREVGTLQIVDRSAGESPTRNYPIRSSPGLNDKWLRSQPPSVPDYVRASLERRGYQVAEKREVLSVELENGRRVAIPVDQVAVDYVGQHPL